MKLVLALVLCGAACSLASPTCSEEEVQKCYKYDPRTESKPYVDTDEDLVEYCKSVDCLVDYMDRCEATPGFDMPGLQKQLKKIANGVCIKDNPIRQRFLDNAVCLNRVIEIADECRKDDGTETDHKKHCEKVKKGLECAYGVVEKRCGKEAKDVYAEIYPDLDFYGCA